MIPEKILPTHTERGATVYLRQSTLKQVLQHRESTARQYGLQARAAQLGWPADRIEVIDEDLGQSGSSAEWREGFQRLAENVAHGRIGAIFALEVSRLARSSADWHRLLELCGLADVVIVDEQAVYNPRDYNDRLLLGLKGTMSEAEQYWMRLRLEGGRLSKARRGELYFCPPGGYVWDSTTLRFRLDPDEQVQRAIRLVFERFRLDGSAYSVTRYFAGQGLKLPARDLPARELRWVAARHTLVLSILHNPIYAGAYAFGRHEERTGLVNGKIRRRQKRRLEQEAWKSFLKDRHPAYICWEEYVANQQKLKENRTSLSMDRRGAAREGGALLQGLALCGKCGRRMSSRYPGAKRHGQYQCRPNHVTFGAVCWAVSAQAIDRAVAEIFLAAVRPPEIELALAVAHETERQAQEVDGQWKLRLERLRYEAKLTERRYKAIDPDNRVVARTLEREWNDKLKEMEDAEREHQEMRRREKVDLSDEDRARIVALAKDLPTVWNASTTTQAERKNLLRMLVKEVTLSPVDVPEKRTRIQVLWQTGAVSELTVPRKDKYTATSTPADSLLVIRREFAAGKEDVDIVACLNREGLMTGYGRRWDVPALRRARYAYGLYRPSHRARKAPDVRADGLISIHGVAKRFGVSPSAVKTWVQSGILKPTDGGGTGHPLWFQLDGPTVQKLEEDARRRKR
ncbi:MAG: recombinase [Lentisphaerae bacterium RIFOXYA12_64_32]|nr:MAG: recombinase [Lentisphaerae bacterium RIFOXYA12_64_32]